MRLLVTLLLVGACADPINEIDVVEPEPVAPIEMPEMVEPELVPPVLVPDNLPSAVARAHKRRRWTGRVTVSRAQLWNVPDETGTEATIIGLLRIGGTEVEWQNERDLIGFWQVAQTVRARHCNRERIPEITECEAGEETYLSALRRLSKFVMGVVPPRNSRQRWVRNVDLSCEQPEGFPANRSWATGRRGRLSLQESCQAAAELARGLVTGSTRRRVTGAATPLAWGGRCETSGGACDDPNACRRGLTRIPIATENAFWCRPGSRGCPPPVVRDGVVYSDEVCAQLEIPAPARVEAHAREDNEESDEDDDTDRLG